MLDVKEQILENRITKDQDSDSLKYWIKSSRKIDSIKLLVTTKSQADTLKLNLRKTNIYSLEIKPLQTSLL